MKRTVKKGFALVELIIVIAVIGVLAAILIPIFANSIDKANEKSALSDARNTVSKIAQLQIDNKQSGERVISESLVIIAEKSGKFYAYGYDEADSSDSFQISEDNPCKADNIDHYLALRAMNELQTQATAPAYDGTVYTEADGGFYFVPQVTKGADDYNNYNEALGLGNGDIYVFEGMLLPGRYTMSSGKGQVLVLSLHDSFNGTVDYTIKNFEGGDSLSTNDPQVRAVLDSCFFAPAAESYTVENTGSTARVTMEGKALHLLS